MAEIQWLSRRGFVPVTPLGDTVEALTDYVQVPSGWRAYGIAVPVGGTVQIEVQHGNLGWFRLMLVDKWGQPGRGMLQAAIAPQPVLVTYKNPNKEATAVYVIVDDPAWWSDAQESLHPGRAPGLGSRPGGPRQGEDGGRPLGRQPQRQCRVPGAQPDGTGGLSSLDRQFSYAETAPYGAVSARGCA